MGGKAIKGAVRLEASYYDQVAAKISVAISGLVIESYYEKDDFGDLDILSSEPTNLVTQSLSEVYPITEIVSNGPVTSYGIKLEDDRIFQVDVIHTKPDDLEISYVYFSYNDLGNLMGRIAHKMGLKYGHDGLWYIIRDGDQLLKEVLLSKNPQDIFDHLGFDFDVWEKGFGTLEEIFEFVIHSKFFDSDCFPLEHRSNAARTRDAKRPTYRAFLEYINKLKIETSRRFFKDLKSCFFAYHVMRFPHLYTEFAQAQQAHMRSKEVKEKFNGTHVMKLTGLTGKDLGDFIRDMKAGFGDASVFDEWIMSNTQEYIDNFILSYLLCTRYE